MAKKSARSKGYRKQNTKKPYLSKRDILILCIAVVLLAIGAFFLFRYDDGALKIKDGAVVTEGDNWLIVNGSNVRGRARYFKLGEIGDVAGCAREAGALLTDPNVPQYVFTPEGAETDTLSLSVTSSHSPAQALAETNQKVWSALENYTVGEVHTAQIAGQTLQLCTYDIAPAAEAEQEDAASEAPTEAEPEPQAAECAEEAPAEGSDEASEADGAEESAPLYSRSLVGYLDASHESCVVFLADSRAESPDDCLDEEALTALLESAVKAMTLEE